MGKTDPILRLAGILHAMASEGIDRCTIAEQLLNLFDELYQPRLCDDGTAEGERGGDANGVSALEVEPLHDLEVVGNRTLRCKLCDETWPLGEVPVGPCHGASTYDDITDAAEEEATEPTIKVSELLAEIDRRRIDLEIHKRPEWSRTLLFLAEWIEARAKKGAGNG